MNEKHTCCWCGKQFIGWGHNPYPLVKDEGARCCDSCNQYVILERIRLMTTDNEEKGEDKNESITGK